MIKEGVVPSNTSSTTKKDTKNDKAQGREKEDTNIVADAENITMDNDNNYRNHINSDSDTGNSSDHHHLGHERWSLFLKVMNNLRQCTNQL